MLESGRDGRLEQLAEIVRLLLCWGDVSDRPEEPSVVVPVDPFEGGEFDRFEARQGPRRAMSSVLYSPMMDSAKACPRLDRGALS